MKISWEIIDGNWDDLERFAHYIKNLVLCWITPILVVWGWLQISRKWNELNPWISRLKWEKWENFTSPELLEKCVLPTSTQVLNILENLLGNETIIIPKNNIICEKLSKFWEVWYPKKIIHSFEKWKIHILSFVWVEEFQTMNFLNTNADDLTLFIWKILKENLLKVIFLTGTWGIQNKRWTIFPQLTQIDIELILEGKHPEIEASGGMYKKVQILLDFLSYWISPLILTNIKYFQIQTEEILKNQAQIIKK